MPGDNTQTSLRSPLGEIVNDVLFVEAVTGNVVPVDKSCRTTRGMRQSIANSLGCNAASVLLVSSDNDILTDDQDIAGGGIVQVVALPPERLD